MQLSSQQIMWRQCNAYSYSPGATVKTINKWFDEHDFYWQTSNEQQFCKKKTVDEHAQSRITRLVQAFQTSKITQITTLYNLTEQKSLPEQHVYGPQREDTTSGSAHVSHRHKSEAAAVDCDWLPGTQTLRSSRKWVQSQDVCSAGCKH